MSIAQGINSIRDRWEFMNENAQAAIAGSGTGVALAGALAIGAKPAVVFGMIAGTIVIATVEPQRWLAAGALSIACLFGTKAAIEAVAAPATPAVQTTAATAKP